MTYENQLRVRYFSKGTKSSADLPAFVRLLAAFCDVTTAALRCFAFASRKQPTVASDRVTSRRVARRRLISPYDVMMRWADSPRDLVATNSPAGSRSALNCHVAHIVSIAFVRSPCYRKVKKNKEVASGMQCIWSSIASTVICGSPNARRKKKCASSTKAT